MMKKFRSVILVLLIMFITGCNILENKEEVKVSLTCDGEINYKEKYINILYYEETFDTNLINFYKANYSVYSDIKCLEKLDQILLLDRGINNFYIMVELNETLEIWSLIIDYQLKIENSKMIKSIEFNTSYPMPVGQEITVNSFPFFEIKVEDYIITSTTAKEYKDLIEQTELEIKFIPNVVLEGTNDIKVEAYQYGQLVSTGNIKVTGASSYLNFTVNNEKLCLISPAKVSYDLDLTETVTGEFGVLAPGSKGSFIIKIDNNLMDLYTTVLLNTDEMNLPLTYSLSEDFNDSVNDLSLLNIEKYLTVNESIELKIYWKWDFTSDMNDTQTGLNPKTTIRIIMNFTDKR